MKNIFKIFIFIIFCLTSSAFAKSVVIPSVTVTENNQGYNIILNTTQKVKYKKVNENSNTIYFEINNVKANDDIPVKYEDIRTIESVTIQKVSSDKIRVYVKGDITTSARLYITDEAGNPFYVEANKFSDINGKNVTLLVLGVLILSALLSSSKKEDAEIARTVYENKAMLQNMKQNKIIRINDFLNKENMTNPVRSEGDTENSLDLGMARKSA